ncbi:hypothetical protein [Halarcobacter sp.]|uniref:hypothetical protein n=1 Tax=Halarcobacter sp. TaxID=2321133 RepID=UPI0029F4BAF9|nr:hypothetical protein [Halarcobacter sp.]
MQDRYAADIGDFGKFQLLRYLFLDSSFLISQLWFMYPDETHNSDGRYINYFEKVKGFDKDLEDSFKYIIENRREVKALEDARLINNTSYFRDILEKDCNLEYRKNWFLKAYEFSKNKQIILTDSDNGIATRCDRVKKDIEILSYNSLEKKSKSGKYIFLDEIEMLFDISETLIVYHHLNRCFSHDEQIEILLQDFKNRFKKVLAIKHKPYSPRVYFFLVKEEKHYNMFLSRLKEFEENYAIHWKLFL